MYHITPTDAMNLAAVAAAIWAGVKSSRADRQTRSTGNGFAAAVKEALENLQRSVDRLEDRLDRHIDKGDD